MLAKTHPGIEVAGDLTNGVVVTIYGRERIRAVRDSAARRFAPYDLDLVALQRAVGEDVDQVTLYTIEELEDANDVAALLREVRNGDDPAPAAAAKALLAMPRRMVTCPECNGEGEIEEERSARRVPA